MFVVEPDPATVGVTDGADRGVRERGDGEHLVGELDGRVDALLGLEPRVGSAPVTTTS